LAAGFAVGLVEYGKSHVTTYAGYREVWSRPDKPLLYSLEVADMFSRADEPNAVMAVATFEGFFARPGVPRLTALLGGIVLPMLLVLTALGIAIRRRWLRVLLLWVGALFLFSMMVQQGKYFSGARAADVQAQIAADGIYVTNVEAGRTCLGRSPCIAKPYYAFTHGLFAAEGVPKPLAIGLGLVVPGFLLLGSLAIAFRPRPRKTPL
jgi:hypothetical protein